MPHYDEALPMHRALAEYFETNGFGADGGYDAKWVKLKLGPIPFAFPNSAQRVRAVRFHDLHHVLTAYDTDWTGEAEIGAWEVASGCADHYAAWVLNLFALFIGSFFAPGALLRAFARGRRTHNLYQEVYGPALLDRSVGNLRRALSLDSVSASPGNADLLGLAGWWLVALLLSLTTLGLWLGAPLLILFWLLG